MFGIQVEGSQIVIVFSLLLNAIMILIVLYLVYKTDQVLSQFEPVVKEGQKMRQTITQKTNEILAKTINLAQELVRSSVNQSQKNLKISDTFKLEMEGMMKQGVDQIISETKQMLQVESQNILSGYQNKFSSLNQEVAITAQEAKDEIIKEAQIRIGEIGSSIESGLSEIPRLIEGKVEEQIAKNEKELAVYKEQKFKEIDTKIYQLIGQIAKKTIGRSIDISTQEQLVVDALEKARKEKMF